MIDRQTDRTVEVRLDAVSGFCAEIVGTHRPSETRGRSHASATNRWSQPLRSRPAVEEPLRRASSAGSSTENRPSRSLPPTAPDARSCRDRVRRTARCKRDTSLPRHGSGRRCHASPQSRTDETDRTTSGRGSRASQQSAVGVAAARTIRAPAEGRSWREFAGKPSSSRQRTDRYCETDVDCRREREHREQHVATQVSFRCLKGLALSSCLPRAAEADTVAVQTHQPEA